MIAPYSRENLASLSVAMDLGRKPDTLDGLIAWFMEGWRSENPPRLHRHDLDDGGVPDFAGEFRRYLDAPSAIDDDGYYVTPFRAAMARMCREGKPSMARQLFRLAQCDGDWKRLAWWNDWPIKAFEPYAIKALGTLWACFHYRTNR